MKTLYFTQIKKGNSCRNVQSSQFQFISKLCSLRHQLSMERKFTDGRSMPNGSVSGRVDKSTSMESQHLQLTRRRYATILVKIHDVAVTTVTAMRRRVCYGHPVSVTVTPCQLRLPRVCYDHPVSVTIAPCLFLSPRVCCGHRLSATVTPRLLRSSCVSWCLPVSVTVTP